MSGTNKVEVWTCNVCALPCQVKIVYSDDKLPKHLKGKSRFRNRACPCKEATPHWWSVGVEEEDAR